MQNNRQYVQGKTGIHKKNNQSYHVPTQSTQQLMPKADGNNQVLAQLGSQKSTKGTKMNNYKAYTYANQSIKTSINNSINAGLLSQDNLTALNPNHALSYMNEDDIRSNPNISAKKGEHEGLMNKPQPSKKPLQSNMLANNQKKQQIKRVKIDSWIKSSGNPGQPAAQELQMQQ